MRSIIAVTILALTLAAQSLAQSVGPFTLIAPDAASNDQLGNSVAVDGDTIAVGALRDDGLRGSVYIYRWNGTDYAFEAKVVAPDGQGGDQFGVSIALRGNTLVVGADFDTVTANSQGSARVFTRSGTAWTQTAVLTASDAAIGDFFGSSVATDGNTIVVGASNDDVGANADQGSAYVFVRSGSSWLQQAKVVASDGAGFDQFGCSVGVDGNTVVVGAFSDDTGANVNQGAAYVFTRSGITWSQQAKLTANDGADGDSFGLTVGISADTVAVGAPYDDTGANSQQGSAYVFVRSGTTWSQQAKIVADDAGIGDYFGTSVSIDGDTIAVGSPYDTVGANYAQGSTYVFARSGTAWSQQARISLADGIGSEFFGQAVAVRAGTLVSGVINDSPLFSFQGGARVLQRLGSVWLNSDQLVTASDPLSGDQLGYSIAIDGNTAVVGAPFDDTGANADQGSAYVFVRQGYAWVQQAKLTASDGAAGDNFGFSVAISGNSVLIGAPNDDSGTSNQGGAYVFTRSGTTWSQQVKLFLSGGASGENFGGSVAIEGDIAAIGAPQRAGTFAGAGSVITYKRSGTSWGSSQEFQGTAQEAGRNLGVPLAISGDTLVAGAQGAGATAGAAYVFTVAGGIWQQQAILTSGDSATGEYFGNAVAIEGNSIVVGCARDLVSGNFAPGAAYVYSRSGISWTQQSKLTPFDGIYGDNFGNAVAIEGDVIAVGASLESDGLVVGRGAVYAFAKNAGTTWTQIDKFIETGGASNDGFGSGVAMGGGVVAVGTPTDDSPQFNAGSVTFVDFPDLVRKLPTNTSNNSVFTTVQNAINGAATGQSLLASAGDFSAGGNIDFRSKALFLTSRSSIERPWTATTTLANGASIFTPEGYGYTEHGTLRTALNGASDINADFFDCSAGGKVLVRSGSSLDILAFDTTLDGTTQIDGNATLRLYSDATIAGPLNMLSGANLLADSTLTISGQSSFVNSTFSTTGLALTGSSQFSGYGQVLGNLSNSGRIYIIENSSIIGDLLNNTGATINVNAGTLLLAGRLTNNGIISGSFCCGMRSGPFLNLEQDYIGSGGVLLPAPSAVMSIGGSMDSSTTDNLGWDLSQAELRMTATNGGATLEAMSKDVGPSEAGLDRTISGHYPIGTLRIPSGAYVITVDQRDNDGIADCEAIYCRNLIIEAGAQLNNDDCPIIYYQTMVNNGTVSNDGGLIHIAPPCPADFDGDGFITGLDFDLFVTAFEAGEPEADFDGDGFITGVDFDEYVQAFEAGC